MSDVDWLIVGGGPHGVHIAARLLAQGGVSPERLRLVDPADQLLARWRTCTATTGMAYLRSAAVHHLDLDPWSLQHFAGSRRNRKPRLFSPPYDRPSLGLFNDHCDQVIETFGLGDLHIQGRATRCTVGCDGVSVKLLGGGELTTQNLVLALGASEQPRWPSWAWQVDARVRHIFEPGFDGWPTSEQTVAVIGGGISAGQVALRLQREGHQVHLVSRHALREHQFDSDPGWVGPRFMTGFSREPDVDRRRALITQARHRGSVPPDIRRALRRAIARDQVHWHQGEVLGLEVLGDGFRLRLAPRATIKVDRVLLATGFEPQRPGGAMVDELVATAGLPCAQCGYPIVDSSLCWHPRIYVSGPLAELELGPASRNITGARRAGDRLVHAALALMQGHATGALSNPSHPKETHHDPVLPTPPA